MVLAERTNYTLTYVDNEGRVTATVSGETVGMLRFDADAEPPTIIDMSVDEPYRRQGIATGMWDTAHASWPSLAHSDVLTDAGRAWRNAMAARTCCHREH